MLGMKKNVPRGSRRLICVKKGAGCVLRAGGFQKKSMNKLSHALEKPAVRELLVDKDLQRETSDR